MDTRVVYFEDDLWNRKVVEMLIVHLLTEAEFHIFDDTTDLVDKLNSLPWKPNIILTDIQMKPHNGYETLEMLRSQPDYAQVKVVAVTAGITNDETERLQRAGFDGVLAKPINADTFSDYIYQVLSGDHIWLAAL